MDASDTYYTALILDPRVKGDLLLEELEDEDTGRRILQSLRDNLHRDYSVNSQAYLQHNLCWSAVLSAMMWSPGY